MSTDTDHNVMMAVENEFDRQENIRTHMKEIAHYHRLVITMMFVVVGTDATIFSGMIVYYISLNTQQGINLHAVHKIIACVGIFTSALACLIQILSILAYTHVTNIYARPAFQKMGVHPALNDKQIKQRSIFNNVVGSLLTFSHVLYCMLWMMILLFDL